MFGSQGSTSAGIGLVIGLGLVEIFIGQTARNYGRIHEQPQAGNSHVAMWSAYSQLYMPPPPYSRSV